MTACLVLTAATATNREVNAAAATRTVVIEGLKYNPGELTVHRGERIVWVNKDFFPHTVTADKQAFDSGSIAANGTWSYLARKPGEYAYSCTFHPTMKGKITVQ
ncbi:MAG: cupredoxin domain-containing protein [Steroidobacteraceae bacterium]